MSKNNKLDVGSLELECAGEVWTSPLPSQPHWGLESSLRSLPRPFWDSVSMPTISEAPGNGQQELVFYLGNKERS